MDVADHIVADRRLRVPETGAATFESLGEADLLPPARAASLARMVGFRKILVHDYARLDPVIVMRVLRTDLGRGTLPRRRAGPAAAMTAGHPRDSPRLAKVFGAAAR